MTEPLDIDQLLDDRFARRARMARPTSEPGPLILARAQALVARRRRRRIAGVAASVTVAATVSGVALTRRSTGTRISTKPVGPVPTACSVASTCEPDSVSEVTVGELPATFVPTTGTPPSIPAGQRRIDLFYSSPSRSVSSPSGAVPAQISIEVTTSSPTDAAAIAQQAGSWPAVTVGQRSARLTTVTTGVGTPAERSVSYLEAQLSPTVTLYIQAEEVSASDVAALAASINVQ